MAANLALWAPAGLLPAPRLEGVASLAEELFVQQSQLAERIHRLERQDAASWRAFELQTHEQLDLLAGQIAEGEARRAHQFRTLLLAWALWSAAAGFLLCSLRRGRARPRGDRAARLGKVRVSL